MSVPLTSIGGIASGIDFPALADAIVASRAGPIRAIEQKLQGNHTRSETYVSLDARLRALQSAAASLENAQTLVGMRASVTPPVGGSAGFTVSASADATIGSYDVTVLEVATRERLGGGVFASRSESLGIAGAFSLNGVEIEIDADDSLDAIVAKIQSAADESGVRASVVTIEEGSHKFVLSNDAEGAAGIQTDDPDDVLIALGVLTGGGQKADVLQAGTDARLLVDGVEVARSSNTIDDVLDGLTFRLTAADPGTSSGVAISRNTEAIEGAVREFIESYNATIQFIQGQTRSTADERAPLAGDPLMRSLANTLQAAMLGIGSPEEDGGPSRLVDIGISFQVSGTFTIDSAKLVDAIANDPDGVAALFAMRTSSDDDALQLLRTGADTQSGSYIVEVTAEATSAEARGAQLGTTVNGAEEGDLLRVRALTGSRVAEVEIIDGMSLEELADQLTLALVDEGIEAEAVVEDGALVLRHLSVGSGTGFRLEGEGGALDLLGFAGGEHRGTDVEGTVNGQQANGNGRILSVTGDGPAKGLMLRVDGIPEGGTATIGFARGIGAAVQRLTSLATGHGDTSISAVRDRLEEASRRLRDRAEDIQARLELQRAELNRRFAAVEEAIARAQSQGTWLTSQLDQISRFEYGPRRR